MTALLVAAPSTVAPGAAYTVTISGATDLRSRLLVNGTVTGPTICDIPTGSASRSITAGAAGSEAVTFEQYVAGAWTSAATGITVTVVAPAGAGAYPVDRAMGFLATTLQTVPTRPGYLSSITDAYAGTEITRMTNANEDRHAYSRCGPGGYNCDGTRLLLNFGTVANHIINAESGSNLVSFSAGELVSMAVWSPTDPNKLYGVAGTGGAGGATLKSQNATTKALTTLFAFDGAGGRPSFTTISLGEYEGGISDDGDKIALIGDIAGTARLLTMDMTGPTIIANIAAPAGISDCQVSPSGAYVTVGCTAGKRAYPIGLGSSILLNSNNNHADSAINAAGEDVLVTNNPSTGYMTSYRLSDAAGTLLLGSASLAYQSGHLSRPRLLPGWIGASVYDTVGMAGRRGNDQMALISLNPPAGSGTIRHYGYANNRTNGSVYAAQPHAHWNPLGTEVAFASGWGTGTNPIYLFRSRIAA